MPTAETGAVIQVKLGWLGMATESHLTSCEMTAMAWNYR